MRECSSTPASKQSFQMIRIESSPLNRMISKIGVFPLWIDQRGTHSCQILRSARITLASPPGDAQEMKWNMGGDGEMGLRAILAGGRGTIPAIRGALQRVPREMSNQILPPLDRREIFANVFPQHRWVAVQLYHPMRILNLMRQCIRSLLRI